MDLLFPDNLRNQIQIVSLEGIDPGKINNYLNDIKTRWNAVKDLPAYQNTHIYFLPFNNDPIFLNQDENMNETLILEFSNILHYYITYFKEISTHYKLQPTSKRKYYIVSGYCLSTINEVYVKTFQTNKWLSKTRNLTRFCHNLEYAITYFYPNKFVYDYIPDKPTYINTQIKKTLLQHTNNWMDSRKQLQDVLCLDGLLNNNINYNAYINGILGFILDN